MEFALTSPRHFLFLQGPHGPFFRQLARNLSNAGAEVSRIGFTYGDQWFWAQGLRYTAFRDKLENWRDYLERYIEEEGVTDIVLYGDSRALHHAACEIGRDRNITIHCFEEGYLRPYWVTYERGGTNGNSRTLDMTVTQMIDAVEQHPMDLPEIPVLWGAIWHHAYYGFLYHLFVSLPFPAYRNYRSHRNISIRFELFLYIRRLLVMPLQGLQRRIRTRRLIRSGAIYHLVLLQLSHDSSLRSHSDLSSVEEFIEFTISEFADGALPHHILAFKAHPFEDEREPLPRLVRQIAKKYRVSKRVKYIPGGKLGPLLDASRSVVTVNSTASQQALWRGLPVWAHGRSVFAKPEFVSSQVLADFFEEPTHPDREAYIAYRQFLLETSQISGGFYTQRGRAQLLRSIVDLVLDETDPYQKVTTTGLNKS